MTKREFTMLDMYVQPGYLIRRAHQVATAAFSAATSDLDLTPVQFSALVAIKDNPDIDATRVSVIIAFDRTTIGHVLGRLEKRKLITRRDGIADKRTKQVRLTLKGEVMIREVSQRVRDIAETILKPFNVSERAAMLRLLAKFSPQSSETATQGAARLRRDRQAIRSLK
jgi:MarR family transcriptional regulator, lower aerobic nicotinate degradation pathway regulator